MGDLYRFPLEKQSSGEHGFDETAFGHRLEYFQMPHSAHNVFVVDDDVSARESLRLLIRSAGWQPETFGSAEEFLNCPRAVVPNCLVLELSLPDLGGLDLQKRVAIECPCMPVIFITGRVDVHSTVQAMKAGALEFLTKPLNNQVLLSTIQQALERSRVDLQRLAEIEALQARYSSLSTREREVMDLVVSGRLNKQAAGELGISEVTVKAHRGKVMQKMNADSLAGLVKMAGKLGLGLARM